MTQEQSERVLFLYFTKKLRIEEIKYVLFYNSTKHSLIISKEIMEVISDAALNMDNLLDVKDIHEIQETNRILKLFSKNMYKLPDNITNEQDNT